MTRAAVVQTAFLGDVVLTTPLLQSLAKKHGSVDVVTTPENVPLIETHPAVNDVIVYDKRGRDRGLRGLLRTSGRLRQANVETVYLPHTSIRTALLARLARIHKRIGFAGSPGSFLYSERIPPPVNSHETERLHALAHTEEPCPPTSVVVTHDDHERARSTLQEAKIRDDYVVLAPGSRRPTKRWPYFQELAEALSTDVNVVLVGGNDEKNAIPGSTGENHVVANLAGTLSIRETAAVIAGARLVVCNDSVALHLAGAMQTRVVVFFGPTDPSLGFGPRGHDDVVIALPDLPCRPCSTHGGHKCPLRHHRCMQDIEVETAVQIVHNALRAEANR